MAQGRQRSRRIRIHVVHESRMFAEALSVGLKGLVPGASVDGWTKSWDVYVNRAQSVADVVVLDNELGSGAPTPAKVAALTPIGAGIVVVGATTYPPAISRTLGAGAHAYVLVSEPTQVLAAAISAAAGLEPYRSEEVETILAGHDDAPVPGLTRRELEIVGAYISLSGASVPETAARFGLSTETVRTHISHARRKYTTSADGVVTKMELRRRMIRDGWILG